MSVEANEYETTIVEGKGFALTDRPAELGSFFVIAPAVYGWLAEVGTPNAFAAGFAACAALIPFAVSTWRDGRREADDPGDFDAEGGPEVERGKNEEAGLVGVPEEFHAQS